jgi:glycosyltransferase involved in cell wall biosynthesis
LTSLAYQAEGKSVLILNGVELGNRLSTAQVGDSTRTTQPFRFACVARMNRWKGQSNLLRAFAGLHVRSARHIELHLFGSCTKGQEYIESDLRQEVALLGLEKSVFFRGQVDDPAEIYQGVDAVVIPSVLPEPFSLVAVEAQARGIPVVATCFGGPSEIIKDGVTGFLVDPRQIDALEGAMQRLIDDDAAARHLMSVRAAQRMRRLFSLERYSSEFCAEVRDALASRAHGVSLTLAGPSKPSSIET